MIELILLLIGAVLFVFFVFYFSIGFGQVIAAKRRGKPIRTMTVGGRRITLETPKEKAAREQREARRRYLDSLVDR